MTFDFAVVEGAGAVPLGAQSSSAGEAQRPSQIRLVAPLRTRLARLEAVVGEIPRRTLACSWIERRLAAPQRDQHGIDGARSNTCAGGDVPGPDGPVAVAAGAEVAGQLALPLLEGSRWTLDTALLLAVVVRPRGASD